MRLSNDEIKELLMASIVSYAYQHVMLDRYKNLLKGDNTWGDDVHKTELKLREMIKEIENIIYSLKGVG